VTKNFTLSMNAFLLGIISILLYNYLIKKKLLCIVTFRMLDKVT